MENLGQHLAVLAGDAHLENYLIPMAFKLLYHRIALTAISFSLVKRSTLADANKQRPP